MPPVETGVWLWMSWLTAALPTVRCSPRMVAGAMRLVERLGLQVGPPENVLGATLAGRDER